jgi:hypothetical protein
MSNTDELFRTIETPEFSAMVNLASGFKTVLGIIESEKPVQELAGAARDPAVRGAIAERISALAAEQRQDGHEHPADSALAAYLWLLHREDARLAAAAASKLVERAGFWWARKVAELVLANDRSRPSSGGNQIGADSVPTAAVNRETVK